MGSWRAVILTSGTRVYWLLGAMVATIITAHVLGPQGRGVIAVATTAVTLFVAFGHLSLAYVVVYVIGRGGHTRVLPAVTGSLLAITSVVAVTCWLIAALIYLLTGGRALQHVAPALLMVAFASLPFLLWMENGNQLLVVIGDLRRLNAAQAAGTSVSLLIVIVAVGFLRWGVVAALTATLVGASVVVGLGLARVLRETGRPIISGPVVRDLLGGGLRVHMGAVGTFFFTNAGILLLNQFRPLAEAGYFQLALQLTTATQVVPMAIAVVAYSLVAREGADLAWRQQRTMVLQTLIYAASVGVAAYLLAPVVVSLLAGDSFAPAVPVFQILALTVFGMSLSTVMTPQWVGRGYLLRAGALSVGVAVVGLAGNLLFVPRYGMIACAWIMVASYTLHFVIQATFAIWIDRHVPWQRSALAAVRS